MTENYFMVDTNKQVTCLLSNKGLWPLQNLIQQHVKLKSNTLFVICAEVATVSVFCFVYRFSSDVIQ